MKSVHQNALTMAAGVHWMTSVFPVAVTDSVDSVLVGARL